jgi:hypothetical protein
MDWAIFWAIFFTNSSRHPVHNFRCSTSSQLQAIKSCSVWQCKTINTLGRKFRKRVDAEPAKIFLQEKFKSKSVLSAGIRQNELLVF